MNILIIGGAGFIGSHLADYHLNLGDSVIAVDNLTTGRLQNVSDKLVNSKFSFIEADFLIWKDLDETIKRCDIIYDLAAVVGMYNVIKHPIETLHVNVNITDRLLSAVAKSGKKPRIIVASSSEVYGSKSAAMKESDILLLETTTKAHSSYPISKLCNEIAGISYYKEKGLPVTVVRIFNTVGPRQSSHYGMVLPRFIEKALRNETVTVFSDGSQTRSFCDVRDLCNMLYQLTSTDKSLGQVINIGNDSSIKILDLAKLIINISQSKSDIQFKNYEEAYGKEYIAIEHRKPDLDKLKSIIDYSPIFHIDDTIKDIIKYMQSLN